jgi:uncharacterized protein (DUF58 family)
MPPAHSTLGPPDALAHGDFEMVVRRLADDLAFGMDASLFVGSGLEYAQSRLYQPGDSVKMIDWRLTARTGKAHVKEYQTLKRTSIHLVVDTSASMAIASTPLSKHDLAVWIAAAVGLVGQRRLSPVAVLGAGERETRHQPTLNKNEFFHALEPLRLAHYGEGTRLAERLDDLDVRADRSSVIVVLSDMHDLDAVASLRRIAQRHDVIGLHLEDPSEAHARERGLRAGFFRGREAETGRTFLAHGRTRLARAAESLREDLLKAGVSYLRLMTDEPFLAPLRHFLASRGAFARGRG